MPDIALTWKAAIGAADWYVIDAGLATGSDLLSAVTVSLFTDQALPPGQSPPGGPNDDDPGGWWADTYTGDPIGSLLWTLRRAVIANRPQFLAGVEDICRTALQWLLDDHVAATVTVRAWWVTLETVGIAITITQPQQPAQTMQFGWAWQGVRT